MVDPNRAMPVKLQNIIEGLAFLTDEDSSYLHTMTGEVVYITDEELRVAETAKPLDDFPTWEHEAIRGRGAFRSCQDKSHEYGVAEAWYRYRDAALPFTRLGMQELATYQMQTGG